MWWRLTAKEFDAKKGEANRLAMKAIVDSGRVPGILAYHEGKAVGWCAVAPREEFPRLERSRLLKRVNKEPAWSLVCLFVARSYRRQGVSESLLRAAAQHAKQSGARIVEGYPVEPKKESIPDLFGYHGLASAFRAAGFKEVARPSPTRRIMRYVL